MSSWVRLLRDFCGLVPINVMTKAEKRPGDSLLTGLPFFLLGDC